ncbi:MAG: 1-acyl-sn-glycerol-3-phosphate acyltransferase [Ectothiorhodospiraceae bacterium]|nr:1-acyl-sn-glycerol-3-phosphate acyltransferase [Ectothiorhodospiraceae bacterium]
MSKTAAPADPFDRPLAEADEYHSADVPGRGRMRATMCFYRKMLGIVFRASRLAKRGKFGAREWTHASHGIVRSLERCGVPVHIEGMQHVRTMDGPSVIIGNHMSTLETFVLPMIVHPIRRCTFVIKPSLMEYPVFGHIMQAVEPIVVSRNDPRKDLMTVLDEGTRRIERGMSVILFPQRTRSDTFDADSFNSLGIKLAERTGVPIIPLALKTNAWSNGKLIRDFGPIRPDCPVHIRFDSPIFLSDTKRKEAHQKTIQFIQQALRDFA